MIIDEAGSFIGYGNRRKVVATKGETAGCGKREECEWISVLAGGTAAGLPLPPCYLPRARNIVDNLGEHGYDVRVPKAFNTYDGFREYVKKVLLPCMNATAEHPVMVLTDGHRSRIDLEAVEFAGKHHIYIYLLAPHSTDFLCPLDTHCFKPMKKAFVKASDGHLNWYRADMERFVHEFGDMYNKGVTKPNLVNGFADLGLWPFSWEKVSKKLDGFRAREAMQGAHDEQQDSAIREELVVAAAERPGPTVRVVVEWPGSPSDGSASPLSAPVPPTPTASVRSCSVSTCVGGSPRGMTTAGTKVSPGLGVQKRLWKKKPHGPGVQKPRRLDLVVIRGGELTNEEVVADLRADQADKEQ